MGVKIKVFATYENLSLEAARHIQTFIKRKPNAILALPTGKTPIKLYDNLISFYEKKQIDFSKVKVLALDEYVGLSPESPDSFTYFLKEKFLDKINININNCFFLNSTMQNAKTCASNYEKTINEIGGIDLIVLGIGQNGHIAFNEPNSSFDSSTLVVKLAEDTKKINFQYFKNNIYPDYAITMGIKTILAAKKILLMANGRKKSDILFRALQGKISSKVPASILQKHKNCFVFLDKEAAAKLKI